MHVESVNKVVLARLFLKLLASFLEDHVSSGLGEEEKTQDPTKSTGAELNPVDPLPRDFLGDPVGTQRAGRVGGEDGQHECPHGRTSNGLGEEVGDDSRSDGSFDAGECALDETRGDDRGDVGRQGLREEEDHDAAGGQATSV